MKTSFSTILLLAVLVVSAPALHAGATVRTTAKQAPATLALAYVPPETPEAPTASLLIPLYGPAQVLPPEGLLPIWVGRNDGTPHAGTEVIVTVPADGNLLLDGSTPVAQLRVFTDAHGLAYVRLTTPDLNAGNGGGGPAP
jgi:hypothetical protein